MRNIILIALVGSFGGIKKLTHMELHAAARLDEILTHMELHATRRALSPHLICVNLFVEERRAPR